MPTNTFFNLDPDKQQQFLDAALDEFIKRDYQHASVTQIVKSLGIGKGSAYRYFTSKKELYMYLLELAQQRKMAYVMPVLQQTELDFFEMYRRLYRAGLAFMAKELRYSQFLYNVSMERNSEELGDLMMDNKRRGIEAFLPQLKAQQAEGRIRDDIPLGMLAFTIVQVGTGLTEYILMNYREEVEAIMSGEQQKINSLTPEKMAEIADAFIDLLENGLRP